MSGYECACGKKFDSKRGRGAHQQYCDADRPWEDEETLRRLYVEQRLSTIEVGDELGCSSTTIRNYLEEYGIDRRSTGEIPKEWLIEDLQRLGEELGRTPTADIVDEHGKYSQLPYYNQFDSFSEALREAGFEPNNRLDITDDELLNELRRLKEELGHIPYQQEMVHDGRFSASIYYQRFGGWGEALETVGYAPRNYYNTSRGDLIDEIKRLSDEYGPEVTTGDLRRHGKYIHQSYLSHFDSFREAVEEAGCETYTPPFGPDNPCWRGGGAVHNAVRSSLGPSSWTSIAQDNRDDLCRMCGAEEGLLDVHHIIPLVTGGTNGEWNFMTLCRSCHLTAEHFTRRFTEAHLTDWGEDELPEGRTSSLEFLSEPDGQTDLLEFGSCD